MKKILLVAMAATAVSAAHAQITPFTVEAGYFRSNNFATTGGTSHLEGIQLGVHTNILSLPFAGSLRVGVVGMFGSILRTGGVDGNIFGVQAMYKTPSQLTGGIYGLAGVGYWTAQARNGGFNSVSGFGVELGVGIPFTSSLPGVPSPALEVRWRQGSHAQTRGFFVGVSVQF